MSFLRHQRMHVCECLREWDSLPDHLLKQLENYLPKDPVVLIGNLQVLNGVVDVFTPPVWLHMDLMKDNILMEEADVGTLDSEEDLSDSGSKHQQSKPHVSKKDHTIQPRYILDYGDIVHGDSPYDLLPLHFDVFNLDGRWLECFLESYQLPLSNSPQIGMRHLRGIEGAECDRQYTLSYCAMCYCLLHEVNGREDVRTLSFEEIEHKKLGHFKHICPRGFPA